MAEHGVWPKTGEQSNAMWSARTMMKVTAAIALVALGVGVAGLLRPAGRGQAQDQDAERQALRDEIRQSQGEFEGLSRGFRAVARLVNPSVVHIVVEQRETVSGVPDEIEEFYRRFMDPRGRRIRPQMPERLVESQGSGVIIRPDGYIVTNNHVVGGADRITVVLSDRRVFEGQIVGTDVQTDLAVIRIDEQDLPSVDWGDSDALQVGDWVLAFGNPFGLSGTVSAGIISAVGRANVGVADYEDFLQTDAAINPGNSGGPLVNLGGEVIGITTAIASHTGGYEGIGFAIPSAMARYVSEQLIDHGSVSRGWLGVVIQDIDAQMARTLGLDRPQGVLVGDVLPNGPAAAAGIRRGDILLTFAGTEVTSANQLRNIVAQHEPGSSVNLTIVRDGQTRNLSIRLGEVANQEEREELAAPLPQPGARSRESAGRFGFVAQEITPDVRRRYGVPDDATGVVITSIDSGSLAEMGGLEPGDVIDEVNRRPVGSLDELREALSQADPVRGVMLHIISQGTGRYVMLRQLGR